MNVQLKHIDYFRSFLPVRGSLETIRKSNSIIEKIELDFKNQFGTLNKCNPNDMLTIAFTQNEIQFLSQQIQNFDQNNALLLEALPLIEQILKQEEENVI